MTQFHEGQEVEVKTMISSCGNPDMAYWRKAKIVSGNAHGAMLQVEFHDGTSDVFDADDIRPTQMVWMP